MNKLPIFNDPIYGFITIPDELTFRLIQHPWFQRLRRIHQLGLSHLVYSGAHHTRFHHAMGAMYLMGQAIEVLRSKGHPVTDEESQGVTIAILLHDIGHGPFSHSLEHSIVKGISHETLSALFMDRLNEEFDGMLTLAIKIFRNQYRKKFLHQLVSSQLDMDRLDYLRRDSFFSGVSEGMISSDRIIKVLNVVNDELAVEYKGIYSIEKFIIARRLMYWVVYLHKTALAAEYLLLNILRRAKQLAGQNIALPCTPALHFFLYPPDGKDYTKQDFLNRRELLKKFSLLDDYDIVAGIKSWMTHKDKILSNLSIRLMDRNLFRIEMQRNPFPGSTIKHLRKQAVNKLGVSDRDAGYFVFTDNVTNSAYNPQKDKINILFKNGTVTDIAEAADLLNISVLSKAVKKYFLCYPKEL